MLDRLAARYGYTDEYLLSRPYARFVQMVRTAAECQTEERRERLRDEALFSYLANPPVDQSGNVRPFDAYLRSLGLAEPEDLDELRDRGREIAERAIRARDAGAYRTGSVAELQAAGEV